MPRREAVLLMAYGGPDSLDDVEPYLLDVRGGRPTSPEFVKQIRDRYARIGGRSPLLERTLEQARALERELGNGTRTYVGMRHWKPFIAETLERMVNERVTDVVAIAMTPQYSRMSVGAYHRKVEEAQQRHGAALHVRFASSWHDHPLFLEAVAEKVRKAHRVSPGQESTAQSPPRSLASLGMTHSAVIFTAHSLPERILQDGDPYHQEFLESAAGVARLLGLEQWHWAYQSQASTGEKWLGPELGARLDGLCARGIRDVLVVPIGFVCDHIEVLYDIDIYYRNYATNKGMTLRRTESLNASPAFIRALASIVKEARTR